MVRHLAVVSFLLMISCSGSDSSPGGGGGSGDGGGGGGGGGASPGNNLTSTAEEREALCNWAVPNCDKPYPSEGDCKVDHTNVAGCYVRSVYKCVKSTPTCPIENYDACMKEGALACDSSAKPAYYATCMDKKESCKFDEDVTLAVEDLCMLVRALDEAGREQAAKCVAGPCNNLKHCLDLITP